MKAVIQRVSKASVTIEDNKVATIDHGILVLLGIEESDTQEDIDWLSNKIINLRIFNDKEGIMNDSLLDCNGDIIVVSQFTLYASTKKGNRPSYTKAAKPAIAIPLYTKFIDTLESKLGKNIQTGKFGSHMELEIHNDGPVTIIIDTKNKF
ncbi:MAG: D-aminoacyl-tRNA deacylase [Flavobacteriaceae bacterium]